MLSISFLDKKIACTIGKVEGKISPIPKGTNGFGYDPIFVPFNRNLTFGEMKSEFTDNKKKNFVSGSDENI